MKVLLFNGSPRKNGCTYLSLQEAAKAMESQGLETEILQLGGGPVWDCAACGGCAGKGRCIWEDDPANQWIEKARQADGFVFGAPVYFGHPAGGFLALLDRMFYAGADAFVHKPAAAVVSARRAGTVASLDVLYKYFGVCQMPVVSSTYWNMVFGPAPRQISQDQEGLQTMANLGRNMAWLLQCIQAGKSLGLTPPQAETACRTDFNR